MSKVFALVLVLVFLMCLVTFQSETVKAQVKTIVVPDDYVTIQQAIDNSNAGNTVYVKDGIYNENLQINKSLSLVGENRDTTTIEGQVTLTDNYINIDNFTISESYAGILLNGNHCTIQGNKITNTQFGVILSKGSNNNITTNIFESIRFCGIKIQLSNSSSNVIQRNQIISTVDGIQIRDSSYDNTVSENNIADNTEYGIMLLYSNGNTVIGNNITNSGIGASIYVASNNNFYHNNFINNTEQVSANESYAKQWGYNISINSWNENFWSDYNGTDNDKNGFGDTPYIINEKNADSRPLMAKVAISDKLPELVPELPPLAILPLFVLMLSIVFVVKLRKRSF